MNINKAKIITEYWECGDGCCLNDRTILKIDGQLLKDNSGTMIFSNAEEAMKHLALLLGTDLEIKEIWDHD